MRLRTLLFLSLASLATTGPVRAGFLNLPGNNDEILPVDEAFIVHQPVWADGKLLIGWDIAPGCYLYRDRLAIRALAPEGAELGRVDFPEGEPHRDEHFGQTQIYRQQLRMRVPVQSEPPPQSIEVEYQGCAEDRVCYPPQTRTLKVMY